MATPGDIAAVRDNAQGQAAPESLFNRILSPVETGAKALEYGILAGGTINTARGLGDLTLEQVSRNSLPTIPEMLPGRLTYDAKLPEISALTRTLSPTNQFFARNPNSYTASLEMGSYDAAQGLYKTAMTSPAKAVFPETFKLGLKTGLMVGALDAASAVTANWLAPDSRVAQALQPTLLSSALTTAGLLLSERIPIGLAAWGASKVLNYFMYTDKPSSST